MNKNIGLQMALGLGVLAASDFAGMFSAPQMRQEEYTDEPRSGRASRLPGNRKSKKQKQRRKTARLAKVARRAQRK